MFLAHKKPPPPLGPPQKPTHGPTAGSEEGGVSYKRGTPVQLSKSVPVHPLRTCPPRILCGCTLWRSSGVRTIPVSGARPGSYGAVVLGPLGFEGAQHRPTPRPSVERICKKSLFSDLQDSALQCKIFMSCVTAEHSGPDGARRISPPHTLKTTLSFSLSFSHTHFLARALSLSLSHSLSLSLTPPPFVAQPLTTYARTSAIQPSNRTLAHCDIPNPFPTRREREARFMT